MIHLIQHVLKIFTLFFTSPNNIQMKEGKTFITDCICAMLNIK